VSLEQAANVPGGSSGRLPDCVPATVRRSMTSSFVQRVALRAATPVSLNELFKFGREASTDSVRRLQNAKFLHGELQTRIAQRLVELEALPLGLSDTTYVKSISGW
jgi:hypothetical protein